MSDPDVPAADLICKQLIRINEPTVRPATKSRWQTAAPAAWNGIRTG